MSIEDDAEYPIIKDIENEITSLFLKFLHSLTNIILNTKYKNCYACLKFVKKRNFLTYFRHA